MSDDDDDSWSRLVRVAKRSGAGKGSHRTPMVSPLIINRMRELRQNLWVLAKTMVWRRWSLVALAVAVALYLLAFFLLREKAPTSIPPPDPPHPLSL
jgi:hypothetical protein